MIMFSWCRFGLRNKDNFKWSGVYYFWVNLLHTIIFRWVYHKLSVHMWSACWHHNSSLHSIHMSTNLLKHFFFPNIIWSSTDLKHHCAVFSFYPWLHLKKRFKPRTFTFIQMLFVCSRVRTRCEPWGCIFFSLHDGVYM